MKKVLLLLVSVLIHSVILGQPPVIIESPGFYVDELTLLQWDSDWSNSNVYQYAYDGQGRKTGTVFYSWISGQWVKSDTILQNYNTDNTINTMLHQRREGNSWNNYARYVYTYNSEGNELTEEVHSWDGTDWQDSLLNTTTYDLNGFISLHVQQEWNGTTWEDKRKKTYTVNTDGTIAQKLEEYWGTGWTFSTRNSYTYVDGKMTEEDVEHHNGMAWNLDTKFTMTYDGDLLTSSLTQHWNGNITAWVDDRRFTHTYNTDGSIDYSVNQEWTAGGWINLAKFMYTYTLLTQNSSPQSPVLVKVSPNPFTENIQIDLPEENVSGELKLYDQQGKMVKQVTLHSTETTVHWGTLVPGSYYARIALNDRIIYRKLIKVE